MSSNCNSLNGVWRHLAMWPPLLPSSFSVVVSMHSCPRSPIISWHFRAAERLSSSESNSWSLRRSPWIPEAGTLWEDKTPAIRPSWNRLLNAPHYWRAAAEWRRSEEAKQPARRRHFNQILHQEEKQQEVTWGSFKMKAAGKKGFVLHFTSSLYSLN